MNYRKQIVKKKKKSIACSTMRDEVRERIKEGEYSFVSGGALWRPRGHTKGTEKSKTTESLHSVL